MIPLIRVMEDADRFAVAELIHISLNHWYQTHGRPPLFNGGPELAEVFHDVYRELDPGCAVVAVHPGTGRLMGSCFYHPRPTHVALGIMNAHPSYFGCGAARALLSYITDVGDREGKPVRLTQSAFNLDSYSLYTRAGFVPRYAFQDMYVPVPAGGLAARAPGMERVRPARMEDVPAMGALELEVSGITREQDWRYSISNRIGLWRVSVFEGAAGIDGFAVSCGHSALNMIGPCVARDDETAAALLLCEWNAYPGRAPVAVVPADRHALVRAIYGWGGRNCELHLCQVRGHFQPFRGVSMPTFLPESA